MNCDGWVLDYCYGDKQRWFAGNSWEEPKWLCERHFKIWKKVDDERNDQRARKPYQTS